MYLSYHYSILEVLVTEKISRKRVPGGEWSKIPSSVNNDKHQLAFQSYSNRTFAWGV